MCIRDRIRYVARQCFIITDSCTHAVRTTHPAVVFGRHGLMCLVQIDRVEKGRLNPAFRYVNI